MKAEGEPITPDEFVLRLIWSDFFKPDVVPTIGPSAFQPRPTEIDGISVFREACIANAEDVLVVIDPTKRDRYGIARLNVGDLLNLGLSVLPAPIPTVPGHAVLPELNIVNVKSDKSWKVIQRQLATLACRAIVRAPKV